jgi:hypothetical protein
MEKPPDEVLRALQERAKELECLYRVEELLQDETLLDDVFQQIIAVVPSGWQYPHVCRACIVHEGRLHGESPAPGSPCVQRARIVVQEQPVGEITVYYTERVPDADEGPFLKEERRLIDALADRLGRYLEHRGLENALRSLRNRAPTASEATPWRAVVDFLRSTDRDLYLRIARKMLNRLRWSDVPEAEALLKEEGVFSAAPDDNRPRERLPLRSDLADRTFEIAARNLAEHEILTAVRRWIREDNSRFLVQAVESFDTSFEEVAEAIRRFHHMGPAVELEPAVEKGLRVALVGRFLSDQPEYVKRAKHHLEVDDFYDLVQRTVVPPRGRGKVGGKAAGLYLAQKVLNRSQAWPPDLARIKVPRTWHIASDGLLDFVVHNGLEDVYNQKYLEIEQVRDEYPHLVQVFKNCTVSPPVAKSLAAVLDEFEGMPLIVRSSALLEDRFGAAFSGKYKSLFLANQGNKRERLAALVDAVAEVYASTFGPDPIQYRAERDLIDFNEEMAILIQEVVGTRVGRYWLPAFSGVAFSRNEFRWSPRIRRQDGLARLVLGLGTRAVDRLKDDYPTLLAPGQPGLRVNVTPEEIIRYSPRNVDLIDLETGSFTTVDVRELLRDLGPELPLVRDLVSVLDGDHMRAPLGPEVDFHGDHLIVTFEGLVRRTRFMSQVRTVLEVLEAELRTPVEVEFACDGRDLYLVQCRPQTQAGDAAPVPIPHDVPADRILFSAKRFVSNGRVPNLTHVVYVDPDRYNDLSDLESLRAVGRAVGRLNNVLPKRQFILMGPGRWGSRGDIKLGVDVTYADISNSALLVEIARRKGNYMPDPSFGTHFFQDLVESSIRYLPLYPDDPGIIFDAAFFTGSENILPGLLPEFAHLSKVVRVIDVARSRGMVLQVLMNAELDAALGVLAPAQSGD